MKAEVEASSGRVAIAGEAVEDSADLTGVFVLKNLKCILVGLARMDDDWESKGACDAKLLAKYVLLRLSRGEVVVIVEADLADRSRQWFVLDCCPHGVRGCCGIGGKDLRLMRMDADPEPHRVPGSGHTTRPRPFGFIFSG